MLIVNKREKIKIRQIKYKMTKWNCKPKGGGVWARIGSFILRNYGPTMLWALLTFMIAYACFDLSTWCSFPCSHWIDSHSHLAHGVLKVHGRSLTSAALERVRKKINNYMGDLGIEPRSQQLQATSPATTPSAFVCKHIG